MLVMFTNWTRFRTGAPHCNSMEYHPQITLIQVSEIWIIYPDILIISMEYPNSSNFQTNFSKGWPPLPRPENHLTSQA